MKLRLRAGILLILGLQTPIPALAAAKTPTPAKDVIEVTITDVSPVPPAQDDLSLSGPRFPFLFPGNSNTRDDLHTLRDLARANGLPFIINHTWSITTPVGKSASIAQQFLPPRHGSIETRGSDQKLTGITAAPWGLTVIPCLNPDKTVAVKIHLDVFPVAEMQNSEKLSLLTTRKFVSGETQMIGAAFPADYPVRLYFATVKLVPDEKGHPAMLRSSVVPVTAAALLLALGQSPPVPAHAADQIPAPAKAVVQISVTDVDALEGKPLPPLVVEVHGGRMRDDLSVYESAVCKADLPLIVTPRFAVTTFDGAKGTISEQTQIPYLTLDRTAGADGTAIQYATITSGLSATPHVNSDGSITVDFTLTESKQSDPAWRELGPPNIVSSTVTTKLTFRDGETRALMPTVSGDNITHLPFMTVTLVPAVKG